MRYWLELAVPVALVIAALALINNRFPDFEQNTVWVYVVAVVAVLALRVVIQRLEVALGRNKNSKPAAPPPSDE